MKLSTHLAFSGQCEAAFKFYERCLGGKLLTMLTWGNSPLADQVSPGWREKILHATLIVGDSILMGADLQDAEAPKGFFISLAVDTLNDAERIFNVLAENGTNAAPKDVLVTCLWRPG